jgi:hypothetical protein
MGLNSVNYYNEPIVFVLQVLQSMACIVSDFNKYATLCLTCSMPTGFFIWGYMYPFTFIFGVHQNCWGCNEPSNSSFGGTKKMNCIFSTQGRAFCILRVIDTGFSLLHRVGENFFFLSDIGSDRNWGSVCLCVCPTIFL